VVINDNLLFDEVEQFVSDHVRVVDAVSDRRVPGLELVQRLHYSLQVIVLQQVLSAGGIVLLVAADLLLDFLHVLQQLVNTEGLLEHLHFLEVIRVDRRSAQHLLLVLVVADLEHVVGEVVDARVQQQTVRHVALVTN